MKRRGMCSARTAILATTFFTEPERANRRRAWAPWGKRGPEYVTLLHGEQLISLADVGCLPAGTEVMLNGDRFWIGADGHMNRISYAQMHGLDEAATVETFNRVGWPG